MEMFESFFKVQEIMSELHPAEAGAIICMMLEMVAEKRGIPASEYANHIAAMVAQVTAANGNSYARQEA